MAESPFTYYRGTPAVMAFDLATTPRTDIIVQASGDAHLSNFGLFASPERRMVFDANDFDETLPGPWEWDIKRLAASIVIAGRANGFDARQNRVATMASVRAYREWMARYAGMHLMDVWYSYITADAIREAARPYLARMKDAKARQARLDALFAKARGHDAMRAASSLTAVVDGRRVVVDARLSSSTSSCPVVPRRCARSSRHTGPRCPRAAASSWSATDSPTSRSRSWASAASGHAAS